MRYNYDNLYFADEETEEDRGKKKLAQSHTARKLASRFEPGSLDPESVLLDTKSAASLPMEMITV